MSENATGSDEAAKDGFPTFELWAKYEDITTHFNDLLMKLRTQALAGVAALSTIVGIFAKSEAGETQTDVWLLAAFTILGLCMIWIAIWVIDAMYYNRLLAGAVHALVRLERSSGTSQRVSPIELSSLIEETVAGRMDNKLCNGIKAFYAIILAALLGGASICFYEHMTSTPAKKSDRQPIVEKIGQPLSSQGRIASLRKRLKG